MSCLINGEPLCSDFECLGTPYPNDATGFAPFGELGISRSPRGSSIYPLYRVMGFCTRATLAYLRGGEPVKHPIHTFLLLLTMATYGTAQGNLAAPGPGPTLRINSRTVLVDVLVTDHASDPVTAQGGHDGGPAECGKATGRGRRIAEIRTGQSGLN